MTKDKQLQIKIMHEEIQANALKRLLDSDSSDFEKEGFSGDTLLTVPPSFC